MEGLIDDALKTLAEAERGRLYRGTSHDPQDEEHNATSRVIKKLVGGTRYGTH
jgi:hypothetical protein